MHRLNPIRLEYILSRCSLDKKNVLDIGCGGGILSEELCKQGAKVTGIDSSSKSISIAKQHAEQNNYDIKYINKSIFANINDLRFLLMVDRNKPDFFELSSLIFFIKSFGSLICSIISKQIIKS